MNVKTVAVVVLALPITTKRLFTVQRNMFESLGEFALNAIAITSGTELHLLMGL